MCVTCRRIKAELEKSEDKHRISSADNISEVDIGTKFTAENCLQKKKIVENAGDTVNGTAEQTEINNE